MDLFVGGVSETPTKDGNVGPTFTCLIGQQFSEIKSGDRFFFANPQQGTVGFNAGEILVTYNLLTNPRKLYTYRDE